MKEIQMVSILGMTMAAVLFDLKSGKIPNGLLAAGSLCGLAWQCFTNGGSGVLLYLGGSLLPVLLLGGLYYFRMIGAGDIKLLSALGGFLGPASCFGCITASIFFGGMISMVLMMKREIFFERIFYFEEYVREYMSTGSWNSYLKKTKENDRFCFSIPVLLGVIGYLGGII